MNGIPEALKKIESALQNRLEGYLQANDAGNLVVIDPVDRRLIASDYAQSHCAVAFLYAEDGESREKGIRMLRALLASWDQDVQIPSFHFDFNNLALCIAEQRLQNLDREPELRQQIRATVIRTHDSLHDTVNWLPMRYYVNRKRAEWTGDPQFLTTAENIRQQILGATWADGFVDDRSVKGVSFNLQYDLATVSMMAFINESLQEPCFQLEKGVDALVQMLLPDGDINYLGRGCNQIFAWGPWIYLLKQAGQYRSLESSVSYLERYVYTAIQQDNLMLNDKPGQDKYLWWDYHYASVYLSHLLMWLRLTRELPEREDASYPLRTRCGGDSGVCMNRFARSGAVVFGGRSCYLAERGPAISALYTHCAGVIYKGGFAPWQGMFGNKYTHALPALHSFCGLLQVQENSRWADNRILRRLHIYPTTASVKLAPLFVPVAVTETHDALELVFQNRKNKTCQFNLPILPECSLDALQIRVYADGKEIPLIQTGAVYTQFGLCSLLQTQAHPAKQWKVSILL